MIEHRLSLPLGAKGTGEMPGGYRSRRQWFVKSRRLATLRQRLARVQADHTAGRVSVVRGGKQLLHKRHHLEASGLSETQWRAQWESSRWFLSADGEAGKKFGNETIRVSVEGEVSVRLPAPLAPLANAPHGRYILTGRVRIAHRGDEWAGRVAANHAVAYRIHHDPDQRPLVSGCVVLSGGCDSPSSTFTTRPVADFLTSLPPSYRWECNDEKERCSWPTPWVCVRSVGAARGR